MSLLIFNHPLTSTPSTGNASALPAVAVQNCSQLVALKTRNFDELIALGSQVYEGFSDHFEFVVSSIINDTTPGSTEHKLAEAIYFRDGHNMAMLSRIADMTRFQLEHEALAAGLLDSNQISTVSDFALELQLRAWVNRENEEHFAQLNRDDSGYHTTDPSIDIEPSNEDSEDDKKGKKPIFIKVWKKELGRYVTYAY
ncbi:uncharacterized protein N0V89_008828 [Didymosphaeria variabile]|uniref:Uncharacterized protein n=1 Tax=Didymosphaeria variabile TaxID=1932322 RepID=A0A9W8XIB0_9PLEO|nr:uncharacterized protein N0V89_008828 [Didymosphaeria variabile]KAJ4350207.1 hypothetical protein N0V89_008828 [Didymosphaeria variabile]